MSKVYEVVVAGRIVSSHDNHRGAKEEAARWLRDIKRESGEHLTQHDAARGWQQVEVYGSWRRWITSRSALVRIENFGDVGVPA